MRAQIFTIWLVLFVLGSMAAPLFELAPTLYLKLGLVLVVSSFLIYPRRFLFATIFGVGLLFLSIGTFQAREMKLVAQNDAISRQKIEALGYVSEVPTTNEYGQTIIITLQKINDLPENAKVKIYAPTYPKLIYGQIIRFETTVKPYGEKKWRLLKDGLIGEASLTDYTIVGTEQSPSVMAKGWLFNFRSSFNDAISRSLPAAESGLASGLILGEKALLTPEITRQLQISGTTHIIALSGYNITIILSLFVFLREKLSRLANLLVPIGFILAFVVMTGGAPSLIRAAIMGFMPLLAAYLGREGDSFISILFSASIMIAFNPFLTLFDVGFQLSFVALAGMIYLAPILARFLTGLPKYSGPLSETVGAQIAAMPLLAYYFGSVSLISPLSNLVILSFVPLGMLVSFLVGLLGIIWQTLASFIAIPSFVVLHAINLLIALFGDLPAASKSVKIENPLWMLLVYFVLFDFWLLFSKTKRVASQVFD